MVRSGIKYSTNYYILDNYTPIHREGTILQSPCPSVHTFVTDISASTNLNNTAPSIGTFAGMQRLAEE
jgi:hypothetical protein